MFKWWKDRTLSAITWPFAIFFLILLMGESHAAQQSYEGIGEYIMSDVETPELAKQHAKSRAEQNAVEQAGVYVESYIKTANAVVVKDVITTITNGIIRITDVKYDFQPLQEVGGSFLVVAKIKAVIDTKSVDEWLQQDAQKKLQLIQLNDELKSNAETLERENALLKQQLATLGMGNGAINIRQEMNANGNMFKANEKRIEGMRLLQSKDYENAISLFNEAIELDPYNAISYCNRGEAYVFLKKLQQAIEDCNKAISMRPDLPPAYRVRGYALVQLNDFAAGANITQAIEDINKYLSFGTPRNKKNLEYAYIARTTAYFIQHRYDLALADCKEIIKLNPYEENYYVLLAQLYSNLNQYEEMKKAADRAVDINPRYASAYIWRAMYYLNKYAVALERKQEYKMEYKAALEQGLIEANKALELDSTLAQAYWLRGTMNKALGHRDMAQRDLNMAKKLGF